MNPSDSEASLLARLHHLPVAEREEFLRRACAADPALASRLTVDATVSPLDPTETITAGGSQPALGALWALEAALAVTDEENSGAKIGAYKLLQKIGEGGFGVVWMAEQQAPIKRRVALKIIKVGMDTEDVIARFEAERQALARMEHSNIAHVYDAGATDAGRPFFVMELVRGLAITRYCDENRLSAEERLRLFVTVCHAVQHAHQKGVIHRDLKPSNILITLHDGVPVPKIIDFGIAKATSGRLTEKTLFTQFNAFIGTPAYTSPEQMEMSGLDVDTRSDIYSLGVLLYELLTGQPPFDSKALVQSGLEAMRRTIRETDPPRPSHCLGTLSEINRTSVAQQRGTDATRLSLLLRGDLDWIAMRCLEKDRTRRYESAASLAADVERHLRDDLVEARPPSQIYRTRKFIRRHKLGVFAVAAVAVSMIAGLIASSTLYVSERSAHSRATSAEKKESDLRRQEVKQAARTALVLANRNLAEGRVADGLAYLVHASRKDPKNTTLGPRLASALATNNFIFPDSAAFECRSPVIAVHYTSDNRSIYAGTEDGTLRVFDAASGELQHAIHLGRPVLLGGWEFPRANDTVFTVRFADKTFGVFDLKSGRPRWPPRALDDQVWLDGESIDRGDGVGISPDGRWLYALAVRQCWIWDAVTGDLILERKFELDVGGCDFTVDGAQLAVTAGTSVHRWTLPGGTPLATLIEASKLGSQFPPGSVARNTLRTVKFSPNGRLVAVSGVDAGITLFDAPTGNRLQTLRLPANFLASASVVFTSDTRIFGAGRHASGSWDVTTGAFTPLPFAIGGDLLSSSFDATGSQALITTADGYVRVCDLLSGKLVTEPAWREARACAALAPDGQHVIIGTASGTVQRLRVGRGVARPLVLPRLFPPVAVFLPEPPSRVLWMKASQAHVLDTASGREVAGGFAYPAPVLPQPAWPRYFPPVRSDSRFMVMPTSAGLQAWELGPGGVIHVATLKGVPPYSEERPPYPDGSERSTRRIGSSWFSPRGDLVAISFDLNKLGVWHLRTGEIAGPIYTTPNYIRANTPQFSPDGGRIAFGTADGASMIIDVATARPIVTFATRAFVPVHAMAFSPDGTRVVTANTRNEIRVWNASSGEPISPTRDAPDTNVSGLTQYSPDGRWFGTWGVHATQLWDGRTGAPVGESIPAWFDPARFSADSRSLGTAGVSGNVRVWDVPSGQPFTEPMRRGGGLGFPEFSPDTRFLRTERLQNFLIWSVPPRLAEGTPVPEWLLRLATVLATKIVNDAGELIDVTDAMAQFHDISREVAALPADAPLAEWGRWVLDDRANRSIAPGFTITPAEADILAADGRAALP